MEGEIANNDPVVPESLPEGENEMDMESSSEDDQMEDDDSRLQNDIKAQVEAEQQTPQIPHQPTEAQDVGQQVPQPAQTQAPHSDEEWRPYVTPPNVGLVRQMMFELKEPIELSLDEFTMYWPFIDNIWVKQRSNPTRDGLRTTDYYMCRLRRPTCKRHSNRPLPEGKKPRNKALREGGTCNFQIRVVKFDGAHPTITILRGPNSSPTHSHDIDHIDKIKKNSGLMDFIRQEATKAYFPASIYAKFREDPGPLEAAGGKYLSAVDVRNVYGKWRAANPDIVLRHHDGYSYQNGLGIYKAQGGPLSQYQGAIAPHPKPSGLPSDVLSFPSFSLDFLQPYLPVRNDVRKFPHVTLTYAQSMDGKLSVVPGVQTAISGPETKVMTHYLRSRHDAIIVGLGTAFSDNPGLNCRLEGAGGYGGFSNMWQPRPVIIDPTGRWPAHPSSRLLKTAAEGKGKAPWVIVSPGAEIHPTKLMELKRYGGDFLRVREYNPHWRLRWEAIFDALANQGIRSVMVEGGGVVLSELLNPEYIEFIDSVIVTVGPTYLGRGGVTATPDSKQDASGRPIAALTPKEVKWQPLGNDVIMCGKVRVAPPPPLLPGLAAAAEGQGEDE